MGLSAVMIAAACGAQVVAVDIAPGALELARRCGATVCLDARALAGPGAVAAAVRDATDGGAHLSLDTLGSHATCAASIESLRRRGRHVQVGLLPAAQGRPALPMDLVIAYELELRGSHGMAAHAYPELLRLVTAGVLRPAELVTRTIDLAEVPDALAAMDGPAPGGMCLIRPA
ncbi:zinc-binding dehydrogenase [Micromonospora sp. CB01531]|uniref:zinc-binding dehydrogenase n=1 Tax=Micromonospora sp. CB01531 TaxID=1718947 RepID=UPI001F52509D|nr:zinc-binding dehydrogenase [Micromonospora sp. CB01531]